jgi:hypothetical protein
MFRLNKEPDFQKEGLYKHTVLMSKDVVEGFDDQDFYDKQTI